MSCFACCVCASQFGEYITAKRNSRAAGEQVELVPQSKPGICISTGAVKQMCNMQISLETEAMSGAVVM